MQLYLWCVLILIGVFDAREYRIPNYLVLLLLALSIYSLDFSVPNDEFLSLFTQCITGFLICFFVGILFYIGGALAAGDVKLIAILGFIVGSSALIDFMQYIAFSCFFIGGMYWVLNQNKSVKTNTAFQSLKKKGQRYFSVSHWMSYFYFLSHDAVLNGKNITYMPFAPVLIVALAMYQYFKW